MKKFWRSSLFLEDFNNLCFFLILLGSHTGVRIFEKYEEVMREYDLSEKVSYIVTDNAANMKAAFTTQFPDLNISEPSIPEESDSDNDFSDDLWADHHDDTEVNIEHTRISCFAHSLQLAIGDGLKETKAVSGALSRAVGVSNILHRSSSYKVRTEEDNQYK